MMFFQGHPRAPRAGSRAIWLFWQVLPPAEDMLMQLMLNLKSWHKRWEVHQLHTEWNAVEH